MFGPSLVFMLSELCQYDSYSSASVISFEHSVLFSCTRLLMLVVKNSNLHGRLNNCAISMKNVKVERMEMVC